jgi:hypothetical protein
MKDNKGCGYVADVVVRICLSRAPAILSSRVLKK